MTEKYYIVYHYTKIYKLQIYQVSRKYFEAKKVQLPTEEENRSE